ncbi:tRNA ligase [Basidiobolus ranarum]|uniref:tRNA ligase n=1 Tax=Basidiobolus ranarum TaxID=34480 RepID=A0ABR2WA45_9FUNG
MCYCYQITMDGLVNVASKLSLFNEEEDSLINKLIDLSQPKLVDGKKEKSFIRQKEYELPTGTIISSWKFTEYLYSRDPCPFPTLARGLFTTTTKDGHHKILIRGYDKFFNVGEVKQTEWEWIKDNTLGPYEVTIKENGCIIFVSSLPEGGLLVTSKHAMGPNENRSVSHSQKGQEWLLKHLHSKGKTSEEFEEFLRKHDITAVFELCDDTFEEHVLEYPLESSGMYLHGINHNTVKLETWTSSQVRACAQEFGFFEVNSIIKDNLSEVRSFVDEVRETGMFQGRAIEGFVVRCRRLDTNQAYFFKVKYDEPYLMYREWREVTLRIIQGKPYRNRYELTKQYGAWVKKKFELEPELFKSFTVGIGIIKIRNLFLEFNKNPNWSLEIEKPKGSKKTLIFSVAIPGCGKTTLFLALSKLFGFQLIQNDNMEQKKKAKIVFEKAVVSKFEHCDIVLADKNNHIPGNREGLTNMFLNKYPDSKVIVINWSISSYPSDKVYDIVYRRLLSRGENHQSLTPKRTKGFPSIIRRFLNEYVNVDPSRDADSLISNVIQLNPFDDAEANLRATIDALCPLLDREKPEEEKIKAALSYASKFQPTFRKDSNTFTSFKIGYYAILFNDIPDVLRDYFSQHPDIDASFFHTLESKGRIKIPHHITLVHRRDAEKSPKDQEVFDYYSNLLKNHTKPSVKISVSHLVWNDKLMVLKAQICRDDIPTNSQHLHITVGTISDEVKPFQAASVLKSAFQSSKELPESHIVTIEPPLEFEGLLEVFIL